MSVKELNREQLIQLKQHFYCSTHENVSWGELAEIDTIVSDEKIFEEFDSVFFVEDDFV